MAELTNAEKQEKMGKLITAWVESKKEKNTEPEAYKYASEYFQSLLVIISASDEYIFESLTNVFTPGE